MRRVQEARNAHPLVRMDFSDLSFPTFRRSPPRRRAGRFSRRAYVSEPLGGGAVWIFIGINGKQVSVIAPSGFSGEMRTNP